MLRPGADVIDSGVSPTPVEPEREALVAAAQAVRDRERLVALSAVAKALQSRVEYLESRPVHRMWESLRRVRRRAGGADEPMRQPGGTVASRGLALVIDHHWPRPDRDAGSVKLVLMVESLRALGFETILAASEEHVGEQPARAALEKAGLRCLRPEDAASVPAYLASHGWSIDLCVLYRVFCGGAFLEQVQEHCTKARLVFDSSDLNYLREERRAEATNDEALRALLPQIRMREEHVVRCCDATIVVSDFEADLLAQTLPESFVVRLPLAYPIHPPVTAFEQRAGIGFIGGFEHAPNGNAVRYFLADIWPLLRRALPECGLTIVGADPPAGLLDGMEGPVRVLGHVPDVGPWFESLRLTIAPLRYGAGTKGKVASSLAAGVPCVATSVAAEGMALADAGVLVADDPASFVEAICAAYSDADNWRRLSRCALGYAERMLSEAGWRAQLDAMLRRIGV